MGAGKSSVGRRLASRLGWKFEDLDDRIERQAGQTVAAIFDERGEADFRRIERAALRQVIEELRNGSSRVVALGGGAFVQKENAAQLKTSGIPTVFLNAPVEELWQRCQRQAEELGNARPLLATREGFRTLHEARRASYQKASLQVETAGRPIDLIAHEIAAALGLLPSLPQTG
jgi:shikimate kinase